MSRLYSTEAGFVIPTMGEELTLRRRARKTLELPSTGRDGRLFVLADCHVGHPHPLRITLNGEDLAPVPPGIPGYRWYEIRAPRESLQAGSNIVDFWTDATAMTGWALGVEYGPGPTGSSLSLDGGTTWSGQRIGHQHVAPGEYLVRIRLHEGHDPQPPAFVSGSLDDDGAEALRRRMPPGVLDAGDTLEQVRRLATWTATRWRYRNDHEAAQYTPWDPLTILAWGAAERGHYGRVPVAMCVHYAVVFVAACVALGIRARAAVLSEEVNSKNGHFAAEVWLGTERRWVYVDPNEDAMFFEGDRPMSLDEIRAAGRDLAGHVRWGPGHAFQARRPAMRRWIRDVLLEGVCFRHRGVWPRSDFGARPDLTPPAHGCAAYSELDIVWEASDLADGFAMFRTFAEPAWFNDPPVEPLD